jgi:hypothetical protein
VVGVEVAGTARVPFGALSATEVVDLRAHVDVGIQTGSISKCRHRLLSGRSRVRVAVGAHLVQPLSALSCINAGRGTVP